MKSFLLFIVLTFLLHERQATEVMKWQDLKTYLEKDTGKIKVVNFWATWCKPCIEELPDFEKIHLNYQNKDIEVILVSLDQASLVNTKVKASLEKYTITAKVIVLDESDFNMVINEVDTNWSGAIPATLIINKHNRTFYEKQFSYSELKQLINELQNK